MQRLKSQNARFHGLVGKMKLDTDEKKELVSKASAGRCTSSRDLTAHEMQMAIDILSGNYDGRIAKMQAKVRHIAADIGLIKPFGSAQGPPFDRATDRSAQGPADYSALNKWIESKFKVKSLFQLEYDSLRHAITGLERWRDGNRKKELGV